MAKWIALKIIENFPQYGRRHSFYLNCAEYDESKLTKLIVGSEDTFLSPNVFEKTLGNILILDNIQCLNMEHIHKLSQCLSQQNQENKAFFQMLPKVILVANTDEISLNLKSSNVVHLLQDCIDREIEIPPLLQYEYEDFEKCVTQALTQIEEQPVSIQMDEEVFKHFLFLLKTDGMKSNFHTIFKLFKKAVHKALFQDRNKLNLSDFQPEGLSQQSKNTFSSSVAPLYPDYVNIFLSYQEGLKMIESLVSGQKLADTEVLFRSAVWKLMEKKFDGKITAIAEALDVTRQTVYKLQQSK